MAEENKVAVEETKAVKEEKKNAAPAQAVTAVKKEDTKLGFFAKVGKWFREMKSELKKVIWPTKKELTNNTLISLGMMVISALVVWVFDEGAQLLVRALISLAG